MFNPGFIGLLVNPFYIIRRGLFKGIKANAATLHGKLLDFGCGSKPYKHLFDVSSYVGLDIKESGHGRQHDAIDVFYDGKEIPFKDNSFDCVFSSEVFEHVFNLDTVIKEINRVCKMDGKLLITLPFIWEEHEIPFDFARYTSFGIKHILETAGFEVIKQTKTTSYIETLVQLWSSYVHQYILRNKIVGIVLNPILISPLMLIGILLSKILPKNANFYHNNIVLAKKVAHKI